MKNAIEAIFDDLQNQGVSFDEIRPELKKIVLRNLKIKMDKIDINNIEKTITDVSLDIINFGKPEKPFSGNIDAKLIRDTANKYGFSDKTDYAKTSDGSDLLTVKTNRNDLAHGSKSFAEVGKEKSADELIKIKDKVVKYWREILANIQIYIDNQEYLDSSTDTP